MSSAYSNYKPLHNLLLDEDSMYFDFHDAAWCLICGFQTPEEASTHVQKALDNAVAASWMLMPVPSYIDNRCLIVDFMGTWSFARAHKVYDKITAGRNEVSPLEYKKWVHTHGSGFAAALPSGPGVIGKRAPTVPGGSIFEKEEETPPPPVDLTPVRSTKERVMEALNNTDSETTYEFAGFIDGVMKVLVTEYRPNENGVFSLSKTVESVLVGKDYCALGGGRRYKMRSH